MTSSQNNETVPSSTSRVWPVANISLLFAHEPYLHRPAAARRAGFAHVETWWPFEGPVADRSSVDEFVQALSDAGVELAALNFWAGDMSSGERGVACQPDRQQDLDRNIGQVAEIARRTGCRRFNLLYGQLRPEWPVEVQQQTAVGAVTRAARAAATIDGVVLLEPLAVGLNGNYPLTTGDDVAELLSGELSQVDNVGLLFDTFHLGANGIDLIDAADRLAPYISYVQVADHPGRGEPGSGTLPIRDTLRTLIDHGYHGMIAGEYQPTRTTDQTLAWTMWDPFLHKPATATQQEHRA